jgi:hypothetical protein
LVVVRQFFHWRRHRMNNLFALATTRGMRWRAVL